MEVLASNITTDDAPRIMVVEDEFVTAALIQKLLENSNLTVCSVVSRGVEVLERAMEERPDLVLMDIKLDGEMDGIQATHELHSHLDVPVIFLTAFDDDILVERAKQTEPYSYLVKPVNQKELAIAVEMALHKSAMDRQLRESQERYRAIVEDHAELICRFSPDGKLRFVNQALCDFFSKTRSELLGKPTIHMVHPDDREVFTALVAGLDVNNRYGSVQHRVNTPDGSIAWLRRSVQALFGDSKYIVEYQCTGHDITARKQAEEGRERLVTELQEALKNIKTLSGLLPICASCKKIRDDQGLWHGLEDYIDAHSEATFSHSICPECRAATYPDLV